MHFTSPFKPIKPIKLLEHQNEAVNWMNYIKYNNTDNYQLSGGILADTMGLGKTFSIMGMISADKVPDANHLIIVPLAMISTWIDTLSSYNFHVNKLINGSFVNMSYGKYKVYIINYHSIINYSHLFNTIVWDNIIVDEAHNIKNKKSIIYSYIYSLHYNFLWLVTATPIINNIKDIYNLFCLIGYSGVLSDFINDYSQISSRYILRRTISDIPNISGQIATPIIHNINLSMSEIETRMYNNILSSSNISSSLLDKFSSKSDSEMDTDSSETDSDSEDDTDEDSKGDGNQFKMIHKMRLLSMNLSLLEDKWDIMDSNKYITIYNMIKRGQLGNTIFFSNMNSEILCISELLKRSGVCVDDIYIINGSISDSMRSRVLVEMKERVDRGDKVYLILQLKSGACGLNLQYFESIVFFNKWWNQPIIDQAIGRVVRLGSSGEKHIYFVSYLCGYDMLVKSVLEAKSEGLSSFTL
jgi:SNF2 family DNA or RNA helicase